MARLFRCFLSITLVFIGSVAHATVKYTYTGKYFQWKPALVVKQLGHPCPSGCKVAGYFLTQGPLSPNLNNAAVFPLSFSFTDGRQTINSPSSSPNTSFMVSTDSYGDIVAWHTTVVQATGATGFIDTCSTPGPYGPPGLGTCTVLPGSFDESIADTVSYVNGNYNVPGSWVATIGPHEPIVQAAKNRPLMHKYTHHKS
jgi:hypothetical protein